MHPNHCDLADVIGIMGNDVIVTGFGEGGMLPGFHVTPGTLVVGGTVAVLLTVASGVFPAWQAARLPVVQALRRVE